MTKPPASRRSSDRASVLLKAVVRGAEQSSEVRVRDLSTSGAHLECASPPEVGSTMSLVRGEMCAPCTVIWSKAAEFGIAFDAPIEPGDILPRVGTARIVTQPRNYKRPPLKVFQVSEWERAVGDEWVHPGPRAPLGE
jgi:hypothetical protein